jgi:hypothetical protein
VEHRAAEYDGVVGADVGDLATGDELDAIAAFREPRRASILERAGPRIRRRPQRETENYLPGHDR